MGKMMVPTATMIRHHHHHNGIKAEQPPPTAATAAAIMAAAAAPLAVAILEPSSRHCGAALLLLLLRCYGLDSFLFLFLGGLQLSTNGLVVYGGDVRYGHQPNRSPPPAASASSSSAELDANYIEYNLADYCSEHTWSDWPGRHLIRLEKSVRIRLPSIVDFHHNDTHGIRLGPVRPGPYPIWSAAATAAEEQPPSPPASFSKFVPYCLLSLSVDLGHRIYAEGFATGLVNGGKEWFRETLHFKSLKNHSNGQTETGTFSISTTRNSLSLVFEQLHQAQFSFHLVLTPFRDQRPEFAFGCHRDHEYQCRNGRCIARYLACDHHNNCGDHSDEAMNCMARVPTARPGAKPDDRRPDPVEPHSPPSPPALPSESPWPPVPTFTVEPRRPPYPPDQDGGAPTAPPEYIDVPYPGLTRPPSVHAGPKPMNGFHGAGGTGGGFLGDLFRFGAETTNVVKVVRYLLGLLVIIILVTLINFFIWCLITKRDQSFMAPASAVAASPELSLPEERTSPSELSV